MSDPAIPTHLEAEIAELERGNLDDDFDRRMTLYSDMIAARAIPAKYAPEVEKAIADGNLSPSGDRLRYGDEVDEFDYGPRG